MHTTTTIPRPRPAARPADDIRALRDAIARGAHDAATWEVRS